VLVFLVNYKHLVPYFETNQTFTSIHSYINIENIQQIILHIFFIDIVRLILLWKSDTLLIEF